MTGVDPNRKWENSIVFVGDFHVRREDPFFSSFISFKDWFSNLPLNNETNTLILTGDIFHYPVPKSQDFKTMGKLVLKDLKFKDIYICSGSHDYSRKYGNSLDVLSIFDNVHPMLYPQQVEIEGKKFLFLPYYYRGQNDLPPMKEYYENLPEEMRTNDFIVGHFFEEHEQGFGDFIDISYLKGTRIFGHRHIPMQDYYIGTPNITRFDEKGKDGHIEIYYQNFMSSIAVPKFLDYFDLDLEKDNSVPDKGIPYCIWDVYNCPNKSTAIQKYGPIYLREVHKKIEEAGEYDKVRRTGKRTLHQYMIDYITKEKISKPVENILLSLINRN